jgi:hypothetical protein
MKPLRSLFNKDEHLNGIIFDSISDPDVRITLASALRRTRVSDLDARLRHHESAPRAIGTLVRDLVRREGREPGSDIDRLERGWSNWSAVSSRLNIRPWGASTSLRAGLASGYLDTGGLTQNGVELLSQVFRMANSSSLRRSTLRVLFAESRDGLSTEEERAEVDGVEGYVERAWERANAIKFSCSYGYELTPSDPDRRRLEELVGDLTEADELLPPGVFRHLGLLPTPRFQAFTTLVQEDLEAWWRGSDESAFRRVMTRLVRLLDREGLSAGDSDQRTIDILVSIPSIGIAAATAWALGDVARLGAAASSPIGATMGALGTLAAVHATRRFRERHKRQIIARLVEYGLAARAS